MVDMREMAIEDYEAVIAILRVAPGVVVRDADSRPAIERYLQRNPGLSFVAEQTGQIVGCVMCGHDGRRGYLQHLAVIPAHRRRGIARALVTRCLERLEALGILKTHIDVLATNAEAIRYWTRLGWKRREDILRFSVLRSDSANA
jgi:ribosomal protein S18 acetylase RimI-like enzyme